jgi:cold shock protein
MPDGTVKWFSAEKRYGFISPDEGGPDVFVHEQEVEAGAPLKPNERVTFAVEQGTKGLRATGVMRAA